MKDITTLLKAHLEGTLDPDDQQSLQQWVEASEDRRLFWEELNDPEKVMSLLQQMDGYDGTAIWQKISEGRQLAAPVVHILPLWRRYGGVAVILLLLAGAGWFMLHRHPAPTAAPAVATLHDIPAPANNRATITLGSGQQVYLDSTANGSLAEQGNMRVMKLADGQVAYKAGADVTHDHAVLYNTLTNPRGSRIVSIILADGTKVWLNAESTLRYPAAFVGQERRVEITGEAYFEVAGHPSQPFIVRKDELEVRVLGTHFNVNAYDNEQDLRVTLLEGRVSVKAGDEEAVLRPGEQALVSNTIRVSKDADLVAVMAWKNGLFSFNDADLTAVMRQLSRWYDVDVRYEGTIPPRKFDGKMRTSLTLSQVLNILTRYQVHYTIDNRHQITIRP